MKDNLIVNNCVTAMQEAQLDARERDVAVIHKSTLMAGACGCHSAVLSMKPLLASLDKLPGVLVRFAHILQSGRSAGKFLEEVEYVFKKQFRRKVVLVLPAGSAVWRAKSKRLLMITKPGHGLSDEDIERILDAINDDWSISTLDEDELIHHYCVVDACPLGCTSAKDSKAKVWNICKLIYCVRMVVPLLYRWKGFETANCLTLLFRRCHALCDSALRRMYSKKAIRDAERAQERAAAGSTELDDAKKNVLRGAKIVRDFEKDKNGRNSEIGVVLNAPLQHFMNACFEAEALTMARAAVALGTPLTDTRERDTTRKIREGALKANAAIISGRRGREVVAAFSRLLLDFEHADWAALGLTREEKYRSSWSVLVGLVDGWHRLVFYYAQSKFKIFDSCNTGYEYNEWNVNNVAEQLTDKLNQCQGCVNPYFCVPWLKRLQHPHVRTRRRAHRCLVTLLSMMPVCAGQVERKHLLGQETGHGKRKRGRGLACRSLQKISYIKSVKKRAAEDRKRVTNEVLGTSKYNHIAFGKTLQNLRLRRGGGVSCRRWRHRVTKINAQRHPTRGMDVFSRQHSAELVGLSGLEKMQRCVQKWNRLSDSEKAIYVGQAVAENERAPQLHTDDFATLRAREDRPAMGKRKRSTANKEAAKRSIHHMRAHPIYSAGSQLACFDSGLRPEKVNVRDTKAVIDELANKAFAYDDVPLQKARYSTQPWTECSQLHGGLCSQDEFLQFCDNGSYNARQILKRHKISCPLLVQVIFGGVETHSEWHFLCAFHTGTGLMVRAECVLSGDGENCHRVAQPLFINDACQPETSQLAFRRIIALSSAALGMPHADVDHLELRCHRDVADNALRPGFSTIVKGATLTCPIPLKSKVTRQRGGGASCLRKSIKLPLGLSFVPPPAERGDTSEGSGTTTDDEDRLLDEAIDERLSSEDEPEEDGDDREEDVDVESEHPPEEEQDPPYTYYININALPRKSATVLEGRPASGRRASC